MNTKNKRLIQVIIVSLLLLIVGGLISRSNIQAGTNELPQWESRFVLPGVNAQVSAITSHNGTIYLGGEFTAVDGQQSAYVASWDGTQFTPMAGLNGDVSGLTVDPTGDLYAVGRFTDSGANADANYVARWTGSSWMAVGSSVQGVVNTILATNNQLYIGGDFTAINGNANAAHIARWDGTTWQALDVGLNGPVYTLAGAENGDLYVGGDFTDAGYQADADYLAIWKNDAWKPVAAGINDSVHALAVDGGTLYVGGQFVDAASIAEADYLVRWKDDQWTPLGDTPLTGAVNALTVDASGNLLVGGTFVNGANLADADYVAQWDGTTWSVVGGGLMGAVNALHVSNDHIYLGGTFNDIDGIPYGHHFVSWQDNGWVMPAAITGMGLNGTVQTMLEAADGSIIVGGEFADAGGVEAADHIALWDGQQWSALANGLNSNVYALAHDSAGQLYAGGDFINAGGQTEADKIARWDGSSWQTIGGGITNGVYAIALDNTDTLYIGGRFSNAGGDPNGDYIASWNGNSWAPIGTGLNYFVEVMTFDAENHLTVGGRFTDAGGIAEADHIGIWNGTAWRSLGGGLNNIVLDLDYGPSGTLYASGYFTDAGGVAEADGIAQWNGATWESIGNAGGGQIFAIRADSRDRIYVGGFFSNYDNNSKADKIAQWDGTQWNALNSGLNEAVRVLLVPEGANAVYAGGLFSTAGETASSFVGFWQEEGNTNPSETPTPLPLPLSGCDAPSVMSVRSGYWQQPETWSTGQVPAPDAIVQIKAEHTITIVQNEPIHVRRLCHSGTIAGGEFASITLEASEGIENEGTIGGFDPPLDQLSVGVPLVGGGVTLRAPQIINHGTIRSGHGSDNPSGGAGHSGPLLVDATGTASEDGIWNGPGAIMTSGNGGRGQTAGGSSGAVLVRATQLIHNEGAILSGNGGHCMGSAGGAGGHSGKISLSTQSRIDVINGTVASGQPGICGTPESSGGRGAVKIDPITLNFSGKGTKIQGGDIAIYGGEGANLTFDELDPGAVEAEQALKVAVGPGGVLDLSGDVEGILVAEESIAIAADPENILLDDGVEMNELVVTEGVLSVMDATILHTVDLTGPTIHLYGNVEDTPIVTFTIHNNSPISISYQLSADLSDDLEMNAIPEPLVVGPHGETDVALRVAMPSIDSSGVITVGVHSEEDADVEAIMVTQLVSSLPKLDFDLDGIASSHEDSNGDANLENDDWDNDGIPNYQDTDDDGDLIPSALEGWKDSDGDGLVDYLDNDDDGDGIPTAQEDTNKDGNPANDDADGDGLADYREHNQRDNDGDGLTDQNDSNDDGDEILPLDEDRNRDGDVTNDDSDGDGQPDYLDSDDDGDGLLTLQEGHVDTDGDMQPDYLESNLHDTDQDSIPNQSDPDDDGDLILSRDEDANADGNLANDDTDQDGTPDYLDTDDDGDGVLTRQEDTNQDGDPTNDDDDQNGIPNYRQAQYSGPRANPDVATVDAGKSVTIRVLANDVDLLNSYVFIQSITQPTSGSAINNNDSTVSYTPAPGFSGKESFTYTIQSSTGQVATTSVTVTVVKAVTERTTDDSLLFIPLISH